MTQFSIKPITKMSIFNCIYKGFSKFRMLFSKFVIQNLFYKIYVCSYMDNVLQFIYILLS